MKYIYRLLISDQDNVGNFITNNNVALNIMSHMVAAVSSPLFEAYGDRLKLVEMVRHPMYMVRHWYSYLGRFDDEKEFTISFSYKGEKLPWYSAEWKDKYLNLSLMDRCLASISYMYSRTFDVLDAMGNKDQSVLIIPFEEFVIRPNDVLNRLEIFLGRKCGRDVKRTLKKQKVPRRKILDGKGYSAYGWRPGVENSEKKEYVEQLKWIKKEGSTNCVQSFLDLVYLYDTRWPSELSKYGPMKGM